ncbi:hypothetical protein EU803_00475 [Loktanella sp. IMCC34160]|uniref:hypothetical protein n=1 Tax=Loktanella sp. IMCC34160 TaxID=2510646 RepID=UPI00101D2E1C|nr:hypothetical protein [Loktanella sp. IMCC34160]RYG90060.1 hypothetical protein EU803_15725 [Loktanella sp. IMCC34160]RYG92615.1 hypothetical protein EU803_00475 [Loktanella sp. IMCC34160]
MKRTILAAGSAMILLSGCVAQEAFVKQNMRYADYERDRAYCETKATQEVPVNRSPGAEIAVALLTGVYAAQDANAATRVRNFEACMISKGYQRVQLQPCSDMQEARANGVGPLRATERVVIGNQTCVVGDNVGRIIFHNPSNDS